MKIILRGWLIKIENWQTIENGTEKVVSFLFPIKINTNLFIFYTIKNKLEIKRINNSFLKFVFQREVFNDI